MRKIVKASDPKEQPVHIKKHDHSVLGTHTKEEKQRYLNEFDGNKEMKTSSKNSDKKDQLEHVKKHDHSILGKHTKKEKEKYLNDLDDN